MGNKLFISCPMRGRTKEAIEESFKVMHEEAEKRFGKKLEVIHTYIDQDAPEVVNDPVWYLGESLKKLSQADYFIGVDITKYGLYNKRCYPGCAVEEFTAEMYDIPMKILVCDEFVCFKDMEELRDKFARKIALSMV